MVDVVQSRLALDTLAVAPELVAPLFLPMVAWELFDVEAMVRRERRKKMSGMGGVKS
jgi:hypothetical protein